MQSRARTLAVLALASTFVSVSRVQCQLAYLQVRLRNVIRWSALNVSAQPARPRTTCRARLQPITQIVWTQLARAANLLLRCFARVEKALHGDLHHASREFAILEK